MAEEQSDFEKAQNFIKEQVDSRFDQKYIEQQQRQQQRDVNPQEVARRQMGDTVRSFVGQDIDEAKFIAADARDYTRFYKSNPLAGEYEAEVEDTFTKLKDAGRATTREDILRYIVGKQAVDEPDKFTERQTARGKAALERANAATDFGSGSLDKARNDPKWTNFSELSIEEMEKALDGVTF
jgi:hypothetical protein